MFRSKRLGDMDEKALKYISSMEWDWWLFKSDVEVDKAHVIMLYQMGHLSKEECSSLLKAIETIEKDGFHSLPWAEDVHEAIEKKVIELLGEDVGGKLHTARSRNDEVATCIRMSTREELVLITHELLSLRETLLDRAEVYLDTIMPGFTHLQHAQPTTLGHHLMAHEESLSRDCDRLLDSVKRVNICPLGSGALSSTGFKLDRELTSKLLGFDHPIENTMDAVSSRDFVLEVVSVLLGLMLNLSRMAEEMILWSTQEFEFVELDDAYTSTSSIMPQKKNPDVAEVMRSRCGSVFGAMTSIAMILKALPLTYNRDLQEINPHLLKALQITRESVEICNAMLRTVKFNVEQLRQHVEKGFLCATELADTLVRVEGVSFRTAHAIVGMLARKGMTKPTLEELREVAQEMGIEISNITQKDIDDALNPWVAIERRNIGDPSSLKRARKRLKTHGLMLENLENKIKNARQMLEELCSEIMSGR